MERYHQRLPDKKIEDRGEILEIIEGQRLMTLAMCRDSNPYLVTVNFAFDAEFDRFYFHAASTGKKMDYILSNPNVWGQVLEDRGYVEGSCEHLFRTVMFKGAASVLEDVEDILRAFTLLIDQQEKDPDPVKRRNLETGKFRKAAIVEVRVEYFTAKENSATE